MLPDGLPIWTSAAMPGHLHDTSCARDLQVAEWAGQAIEILLRIYAKCLDGEQATMRRRVGDALGLASGSPGGRGKLGRALAVNLAAYLPRPAVEGR